MGARARVECVNCWLERERERRVAVLKVQVAHPGVVRKKKTKKNNKKIIIIKGDQNTSHQPPIKRREHGVCVWSRLCQ